MGSVTWKADKMTSSQQQPWSSGHNDIFKLVVLLTLLLLSLMHTSSGLVQDVESPLIDGSDPGFFIDNLNDMGGEVDPSVSLSNEVESSYKGEDLPFMWFRVPMKRKHHGQLRFVRPGKRFDGHLRFVKPSWGYGRR